MEAMNDNALPTRPLGPCEPESIYTEKLAQALTVDHTSSTTSAAYRQHGGSVQASTTVTRSTPSC